MHVHTLAIGQLLCRQCIHICDLNFLTDSCLCEEKKIFCAEFVAVLHLVFENNFSSKYPYWQSMACVMNLWSCFMISIKATVCNMEAHCNLFFLIS
jgi:hypothetical protein